MAKNTGKWVKGAWKDDTSMLAPDKKTRKMKLKDDTEEEFLEKYKHFSAKDHIKAAKELRQQAEEFFKKEDWGSGSNVSTQAKFHEKAVKIKKKNESILSKIDFMLN